MKSIIQVNSSELLTNRSDFLRKWREPDVVPYRYAYEEGFHIYGKLRLKLKLSAADDLREAKQYLKIIQAYAAIADACAQTQGALLLEIQGEVIHLLLPRELSARAVDEVIAFCESFTQIVYDKVEPMAGDNWQSFVMATDHGPAVLVENGNTSSDSVVSLGPAANAPAKQIPSTKAGCLSIRTRILEMVYPKVDRRKEWEREFDLRDPVYIPEQSKYTDGLLINEEAMQESAINVMREQERFSPSIRMLGEADLGPDGEPDVSTPVQVQGFYMRADLDGFTKDVQEAFKRGSIAIRELVERFVALMGFSDAYADTRNRMVVRLPWAGDCTNMILLPRQNRSYQYDQAYVPATESAEWHSQTAGKDSLEREWRKLLKASDWAVAIIGGCSTEGNEGYLLVASIQTSKRAFRIAAGWGARRSLDGLDISGIGKRDTVIHKEDYSALSENYQSHFKRADSNFYKAHGLDKEKLDKTAISNESKATAISLGVSNVTIPPQKSHYEYR